MLINLIHEIDTLRYICGEITSVYAATSSETRGYEVEDTAAITLKFANGGVGSIFLSDATPSPWSYELTMFENPSYAHVAETVPSFLARKVRSPFPRWSCGAILPTATPAGSIHSNGNCRRRQMPTHWPRNLPISAGS